MSICGDASALIIVGFSLIVFSFLLQLIGVVTPYWIYKMVDDVEYFSGLWQHCGTNALSTTCTEVRCGKYNFVCLFVLWCLTPLSTVISVISWLSVLLVEETGVPGENHRPVASH